MNRDLYTVLFTMLLFIDEESQLYAGLDSVRNSVAYCAPEARGMWWRVAAEHLEDIDEDYPNFHILLAIFTAKKFCGNSLTRLP